jgi:hypothetical protein
MKSQNLIASVAAALFTFATLGAVNYNVDVRPASAAATQRVVTDLPMIVVHPTAAERREAALSDSSDIIGAAGHGGGPHLSLVSSQLAMPYYSFANQFGGISKE